MKRFYRGFIGLCAGLALAASMGMPAAQAASGLVVVVDNDPGNNGPINCPQTNNTTLEDAMIAIGATRANVTLIICPGTYQPSHSLEFDSFSGLKIIGLGGPVLEQFGTIPDHFLRVSNSTNVTIQGLTIDGRSSLPTNARTIAIDLEQTSGTVKGNTIINWRQNTVSPAADTYTAAISDFSPSSPEKLSIINNTIYKSGDFGIWVHDAGAVKVMHNRIHFAPINPAYTFPGNGIPFQAGIALILSGDGTTVSSNQVISDEPLLPAGFGSSRGILLLSTSHAKVSGNTISSTAYGITVESYCDDANFPNADSNTISANKVNDPTLAGVVVITNGSGFGCDVSTADRNSITGNTIYQSDVTNGGPLGISLGPVGGGSINGVKVTGNTIGGFLTPLFNLGAAGTIARNKILTTPPGGF